MRKQIDFKKLKYKRLHSGKQKKHTHDERNIRKNLDAYMLLEISI